MVEMLVVVSIISLLLGMLYSAIRSVQRYSRESITRGELKNIEAAWKQYYAHYQAWPTGDVSAASDRRTVAGDIQYTLDGSFARMLEGQAITNGSETVNVEAVSFLELTRFDSAGAPVNAWGSPHGKPYHVIFDVNGDNQVTPQTSAISNTTIFRAVAVWTDHPEKAGRILGSWER